MCLRGEYYGEKEGTKAPATTRFNSSGLEGT